MDGNEKSTKKEATVKTDTTSKTKKVAKGKAVKEPKPKKEKAPREPLVVFAFRLTETQRDAIHKAAGPGKATRFVRSAALAAASGDRPAFEELLTTAKANLK
jgi:hypothetical protein